MRSCIVQGNKTTGPFAFSQLQLDLNAQFHDPPWRQPEVIHSASRGSGEKRKSLFSPLDHGRLIGHNQSFPTIVVTHRFHGRNHPQQVVIMIIILFTSGMYIWPSVWSDYAQHHRSQHNHLFRPNK